MLQFLYNRHGVDHFPHSDSGTTKTLEADTGPCRVSLLDLDASLMLGRRGSTPDNTRFCDWLASSDGVLLLYDVTNRASFDALDEGFRTVCHSRPIKAPDKKCDFATGLKRFGCVVVGNKADLTDKRTVSTAEGREFADSLGIDFFELDSNDGDAILAAMHALVRSLTAAAAKDKQQLDKVPKRIKEFSKEGDNMSKDLRMVSMKPKKLDKRSKLADKDPPEKRAAVSKFIGGLRRSATLSGRRDRTPNSPEAD